jgi:hypothetical protein
LMKPLAKTVFTLLLRPSRKAFDLRFTYCDRMVLWRYRWWKTSIAFVTPASNPEVKCDARGAFQLAIS